MKRLEKQKMKAERRQQKKLPGEENTPSLLDEEIELMTGPSPFEPEA